MKRRRPRKRRRSIGRRRKGTVGGGKDAKSKPRRVKHSPPEPPRLRPRRKPHHKSVSDVAKLDLSGEDLWRQRRVCIYVHWRDTFDCAPPACWKGKDVDAFDHGFRVSTVWSWHRPLIIIVFCHIFQVLGPKGRLAFFVCVFEPRILCGVLRGVPVNYGNGWRCGSGSSGWRCYPAPTLRFALPIIFFF